MKKGSIEKLCGNYAPAVAFTLDFLQSEMQKRKEARRTAKPYKKNSITKITCGDIDKIMFAAFGPSERHMSEIRQCYFNSEKRRTIRPERPDSWGFNAKQLKDECANRKIDISQKIDQIQRLYISALTVAEVLSKDDGFITANIKDEIKHDIRMLCSALETNYGPQYWKVVLKYFSKCVSYSSVKDLLILLPQCKNSFIDNWIRQLENISSPLHRKCRCALEENRSFLHNYGEELLALDKSQVNTSCTWEEIFYSLTAKDLSCAIGNIYLIKAISVHKLRVEDLELAYLVETQLSDDHKEIFYDELTNELNLDCAIAF